jgi:ABC-2 type transport system permease protein
VTAVPPAEARTAALLGRAAAAEWTRMWTVRTTWWCLLAAAVTIVGIGTALGFDTADMSGPAGDLPPAWLAGQIALMPGQFALLLMALLAVTSEYSTKAIGTTLQWTPRRGVLLAARVAVPVVVATVAGVLLRSTAGALAAVFLLLLVLPFLLPAFGVGWMTTLAELMPGSGATYLLAGEPEMTTWAAVAALVGWSGGALVAGGWSLLRRDAL